jgi:hypothetical protein
LLSTCSAALALAFCCVSLHLRARSTVSNDNSCHCRYTHHPAARCPTAEYGASYMQGHHCGTVPVPCMHACKNVSHTLIHSPSKPHQLHRHPLVGTSLLTGVPSGFRRATRNRP